ncbi:hypothetical protein B0T22DRAFT_58032 [Podospora appendiculata]|uniref:Uncharacterized protein n=1 Tax=Podospora appendiculata TaxID=314037 RepID=A0AAE0XIC6_9PEZI|nr:hypothetical protein B0T22DRAFT_58032 [Podospora appendiculata]
MRRAGEGVNPSRPTSPSIETWAISSDTRLTYPLTMHGQLEAHRSVQMLRANPAGFLSLGSWLQTVKAQRRVVLTVVVLEAMRGERQIRMGLYEAKAGFNFQLQLIVREFALERLDSHLSCLSVSSPGSHFVLFRVLDLFSPIHQRWSGPGGKRLASQQSKQSFGTQTAPARVVVWWRAHTHAHPHPAASDTSSLAREQPASPSSLPSREKRTAGF